MMTTPASSRKSLYRLQDGRAPGVLLMLLFSTVSMGVAYRGVGTRGERFYCEVCIVGTSPREKIWVSTYDTDKLAALACDDASYYTNRSPKEFNLDLSEDAILRTCKPRSAYDSLYDRKERKKFIKAEVNALIKLVSSEDQAPDFPEGDESVLRVFPVRQRSGDVAWTIVKHFLSQAERLREFMTWLMCLSNDATQSTHKGKETISPLDIEEALPVGGDQFLDATRVTLLLDSVEARPGGAPWLTLIASSFPLLFQIVG